MNSKPSLPMEEQIQETAPMDMTVLYISLAGFDEYTQQESPDAGSRLLQEAFELIRNTVDLYSGRVEKYMGEQLIALFGTGNQSPDAPAHALLAAREIQQSFSDYREENELPASLGLRAGLYTGPVISSTIFTDGKRQVNYFGEAINIARNIQAMAEPGQVLAGDPLFRAARERFQFNALEPVPLKGMKKPLPLYEVLDRKEISKKVPLQSGRMIGSRMIGRDKELKLLEKQVLQLINGRGSVVNIEGIAGIGKSRLMAEIRQKDIMENVAYFQGRALSEGGNLSFHPITHIIRGWSGITENDPAPEAASRLKASIRRIMPGSEGEVFPFIATMMGFYLEGEDRERLEGIEGEALERLILKNLRDLIASAASLRPVVIVIEDAHWADQSSVLFLETLFKLVKNNRLMFVNVFRPGYKNTGERITRFVRENLADHHREITIEPLSAVQTEELIHNLLQQTKLPEEISTLIKERSGGNPFFVEEVVRSFIDEGLIEIKKNAFILTDKIKYANIPESIDKVLLSRIDRLDEKTKNLLKTASVIGRNFYYKVLEEAARTIGELDDKLEYLKDVQLLNERKGKDEVEFLFKHALAQQATYDSIMEKTRKELHLKIARSIERVFADRLPEFYGTLAHHYTKAGVDEKALDYLIRASDESLRAGASSEAVRFLTEAIGRLESKTAAEFSKNQLKDLEIKLAFAHQAVGNNLEANELFSSIISRYFSHDFPKNDKAVLIKGILSMFRFMFMINNQRLFFKREVDDDFNTFVTILKPWGEAIATLNTRQFAFLSFSFLAYMSKYKLPDSRPGITIFVECSTLFMWTGISFRVSQKMLDYARDADIERYPTSIPTFRFSLKMHEFMTGKWVVDKDFSQVYSNGLRNGEFWPLTIYVLYTGLIHMERGNFSGCIECVEKLNEISESFDNTHAKAQMYRLMILANQRFRKLDRVIGIAEEAIRYISRTGHNAMLLTAYSGISQAYIQLGRYEEARKACQEAARLVKEHKIITVYHVPYLQALMKIEFFELRHMERSDVRFRRKLRELRRISNKLISESKKMRGALTEAYRIRGMIHFFLGQPKKALRYFEHSMVTAQKYKGDLELSRTYFELGKCLHDPACKRTNVRGVNGSEYLQRARSMFEELDMKWDMERYEEYVDGR